MGLGKTFTGAEKLIQLGGRINLVVCQKSKIADWVNHFRKYYPLAVFDLSIKGQIDFFISAGNERIGVINYDLIFRRPELKKIKIDTLMLDESSLIQNEMAKRSKFILQLKPSNVILLSGTPTSGKYENLWSQLHLLGWNISKELYWQQYIDYEWQDKDGFPLRVVHGYKNVERLKKKLREHGAFFLKTEEVFDLPSQTDNFIYIPITPEYKKFKKSKIILIDDHELVGDTTLTQILYERQLCGQYNKAKLVAFKDLVESTNDRLIVFYNFTAELELMRKIAAEYCRPISVVNGHEKDLLAYEESDNSVTFIQYQAGAMGLNLQKANKIIYFTLPLGKGSCGLWEQSKKRIHRIGQNRPCFYYYMICPNSIEEKNLASLKLGRDLTNDLFEEG
jgi:SNF2 family DNA or RNA helicase